MQGITEFQKLALELNKLGSRVLVSIRKIKLPLKKVDLHVN